MKHDHLIHKGLDDHLYGQIRVRTRQFFRADLKKAQEEDPTVISYLVCSYCYAYVPENHEGTRSWLLQGHACPVTKKHHYPRMVYRSLDPESEIPCDAVQSGLDPMQQIVMLQHARPKR